MAVARVRNDLVDSTSRYAENGIVREWPLKRGSSQLGLLMARRLDIAEVSERTGLRASTLRYYERIGLLPVADQVGGRRVYPAVVLRRLALIRMTQRAGFTLREIRALLSTDSATPGMTGRWRSLAEQKLPDLDRRIAELQTLRTAVADCLACGCMRFETCSLLNPLRSGC
jgi:MerR family redox-sensitive transcriptional activator SoxR